MSDNMDMEEMKRITAMLGTKLIMRVKDVLVELGYQDEADKQITDDPLAITAVADALLILSASWSKMHEVSLEAHLTLSAHAYEDCSTMVVPVSGETN